jgi:DeoR/GlpR family transcriptional regulator of sugar metabolism
MLCELSQIDMLITDARLSDKAATMLDRAGVQQIIAGH